jgi:ATP-dependent DNA helicase DinG
MRQRAMDADIIVVNHHLFFADLALRNGAYGAGAAGLCGSDPRRGAPN